MSAVAASSHPPRNSIGGDPKASTGCMSDAVCRVTIFAAAADNDDDDDDDNDDDGDGDDDGGEEGDGGEGLGNVDVGNCGNVRGGT